MTFDWLREELLTIRNRKFHIVQGPSAKYGWRRHGWPAQPPESYSEFMTEFGAAQLYRELSYWLLRVYKRPIVRADRTGCEFLAFGGFGSGMAYFRRSDLGRGAIPVYETRGPSGLFITSGSFEGWLVSKSRAARKHYTKTEWIEVLRGPDPFTPQELEIVAARRKYEWALLRVSGTARMTFRVTNHSDRRLPFLTIGVRGPNLIGGIWLAVSEIGPGETRVVEHDAYQCTRPETQEAFAVPDPWPEDRERYWEFRAKTARRKSGSSQ
jgi:hypothetical protein